MTPKKRTIITSLILGAIILLLIFFAVNPIFSQIKRESGNLIAQKKELLESEAKIKNLRDFQNNLKRYQPNLEKISQLFIDISEPIEFIEFLENEAAYSRLSIAISPPALKKEDSDFWPALEFSLNLNGFFPDFLQFLERLESSPYLIEPMNIGVSKTKDEKEAISATLLLRVYAK